ncbi:MAG: heme exporter protein CcmD [Pseudomonadales bacterium]|nr:heme exporter protein CcmD [Pseudomonadales bacterium]
MYFDSLSNFLQMGQHGLYVWSAYGVTALVLLVCLWYPIKRRKVLTQEYVKRMERETSRKKSKRL